MSNKIGRNDKCPCGSGKKYKKCCADKIPINEIPQMGIIVKNLKTGFSWQMGHPGLIMGGVVFDYGNFQEVEKNISNYFFVLDVDLPFLLPLNDETYKINIEETKYFVFHKTMKRGEETFSTLDSNNLPYFSHLIIQGIAFLDDFQNKRFKVKDEGEEIYFKSYVLILKILEKIVTFLRDSGNCSIQINTPILSYVISYVNRNLPVRKENIVAHSVYPYSGNIEIEPLEKRNLVDSDKLKAFLTESLKLQEYVENTLIPTQKYSGLNFSEKVFLSIHDFLYYCRQHPKVLNKLGEELIRDLYLIVVKILFTSAEGEAYNHKGKLDYKILNIDNKYEFISGEFKWWNGGKSLEEVYDQIVRKHTSGQEKEVYIVILSKNKSINDVGNQIPLLIKKEKETIVGSLKTNIVPKGSNEYFIECLVSLKGADVPLKVGLVDLYCE